MKALLDGSSSPCFCPVSSSADFRPFTHPGMLVLTKQDRLCHVIHSSSDPFYLTWLRQANVSQHCTMLSIGDSTKAEAQEYYESHLLPHVPAELRGRLQFEELYGVFGGKLAHLSDYIAEFLNSDGEVTRKFPTFGRTPLRLANRSPSQHCRLPTSFKRTRSSTCSSCTPRHKRTATLPPALRSTRPSGQPRHTLPPHRRTTRPSPLPLPPRSPLRISSPSCAGCSPLPRHRRPTPSTPRARRRLSSPALLSRSRTSRCAGSWA